MSAFRKETNIVIIFDSDWVVVTSETDRGSPSSRVWKASGDKANTACSS